MICALPKIQQISNFRPWQRRLTQIDGLSRIRARKQIRVQPLRVVEIGAGRSTTVQRE